MPPSASHADGRRVTKTHTDRDTIIVAIRRWDALFGEPPCTADWNPSIARWRAQEWRIERYVAGDPATGERWPSLNAVKRRFGGSFDAAVREAGLEPRRPGPRRRAAGAARPDIEPRAPMAPVAVDAALVAAADRAAAAEARAAELQEHAAAADRRARGERARAERAQARTMEARDRARRLADRARRAVEARDRARVRETTAIAAAREVCEDRLAATRADADQRIAQALERARRAEARADRAEECARRADDLLGRGGSATGRPESDVAAPVLAGPAVLGSALARLARIRAAGAGGGIELRGALREVAEAATRWADRL